MEEVEEVQEDDWGKEEQDDGLDEGDNESDVG